MKCNAIITQLLSFVCISAVCSAGSSVTDEATARVSVFVQPALEISVDGASTDTARVSVNVDNSGPLLGIIPAEIVFHARANVQTLRLAVIATDLYKDNSPLSEHIIPLKTDGSSGALVELDASAGAGLLSWGQNLTFHGLNAWMSEIAGFQSDQDGRFDQDVRITIEYEQSDPTLPSGEYVGWVKLVCEITPE